MWTPPEWEWERYVKNKKVEESKIGASPFSGQSAQRGNVFM